MPLKKVGSLKLFPGRKEIGKKSSLKKFFRKTWAKVLFFPKLEFPFFDF